MIDKNESDFLNKKFELLIKFCYMYFEVNQNTNSEVLSLFSCMIMKECCLNNMSKEKFCLALEEMKSCYDECKEFYDKQNKENS